MERRYNPIRRKRLLALQLGAIFLGLIVGAAYSTQTFAARTGYATELGTPLFSVGETGFYPPWKWLTWYLEFGDVLSSHFAATKTGLLAGLIGGVAVAAGLKQLLDADEPPTDHGSSRWASDNEIEDTGLPTPIDDRQGIVLGRLEDGRLLTHDGPEHAFCFAPTRSGKGVGLVVPTLLTWTESVVVLDVKRENWEITAAWRNLFSHTICFDPTSPDTARFNPLEEVRRGPEEVRDVRNIVEILCDPDGDAQDKEDFWTASAKDLLTGTILHVLYAEEDKSLAGVLRFLRHPEHSLEEKLQIMLETDHKGGSPHRTVAQVARSLLDAPEKTRGGIVKTAERFLSLFDDPVLAAATRESDFTLDQLQNADSPVSLYLAVPPSDMQRLRPILRLLLIQMGSALTEELDAEDRNHRLLLLLDEFPTLGGMDWFESALAYFAGYDIRAYLIAQDLNQIEKAYGRNNAILGNCHLRVAFAPNDDKTASRISDLLGETTARKESKSLSGDRSDFMMERHSKNESLFQRNLLTPGDVMQLPDEEEILMVAGEYPIRARKVRYYQNPHFKRLCPEWNDFDPLVDLAADPPPQIQNTLWDGALANTPIDLSQPGHSNDFQAPPSSTPSETSTDSSQSDKTTSDSPEISEAPNPDAPDSPLQDGSDPDPDDAPEAPSQRGSDTTPADANPKSPSVTKIEVDTGLADIDDVDDPLPSTPPKTENNATDTSQPEDPEEASDNDANDEDDLDDYLFM